MLQQEKAKVSRSRKTASLDLQVPGTVWCIWGWRGSEELLESEVALEDRQRQNRL